MTRRRLVERAVLLPWAGVLLLTPPAVVIVQEWSRALGRPLFLVYVFAVWLVLILLGGLTAARLDAARLDAARTATRTAEEGPC